jgi:2-polyprenyl-3-methyl-5-hydroxy-6-metoxy-1,4-benzoquinol methylase
MKHIDRIQSVITDNKSLQPLYELKNFPVFIGVTEQPIQDDLFADMSWNICTVSGVIQLNPLLPPEIIYSSYHSEAIGNIWEEHHIEFIKFSAPYSGNNILEIGGSNGFIAESFIKQYPGKKWTIIEPNPNFMGTDKIRVIKDFFNNKFLNNSYDTIVHSHVIEHIYYPKYFLNDICNSLNDGEYHIFSIPNLKSYLENKFTNTINFEHTFFLTEYLMDYLLSVHQFEIVSKKYFKQHSIFYATKKNSEIKPKKLINHFFQYKELYLQFIEFYKVEISRLNYLMDNFEGRIYLFGAHIFSQFLLYSGLNSHHIYSILDNSQLKIGKRLYGSNLKVSLPKSIQMVNSNIAVILKAGEYQQEVKNQLQELNSNITIWE